MIEDGDEVRPHGISYDAAPPVLIFADRADGIADGRAAAEAAGARVAAALPLEQAPSRIRDQPEVAAIYLDVASDVGPTLTDILLLLDESARQGRCRSVVVLPMTLVDLAASQAWHPDVALLSRADADDRADAMRTALAPRSTRLNDAVTAAPLRRLSKGSSQLGQLLASMSAHVEAGDQLSGRQDEAGGRAADLRAIIQGRRLRDRHFPPDLFADPAWDMLLALKTAELEQRRMTVTNLCEAAAVPSTTALRWISALTKRGFLTRTDDPGHGRRIFIGLSDAGRDAMAAYLDDLRRAGTGLPV